jgi:hypothetical protein
MEAIMLQPLTERYKADLLGELSCFDRIVITGTLPGACFAQGMTSYLYSHHILINDYTKVLADPMRNHLRENAQEIAKQHGLVIEHINKPKVRKESVVAKVLKKRGEAPGLVHIISAMEACTAYMPWHDKQDHKTFLRATSGKCLHYYFYFMDEEVGLCYLRVPTWLPCRLQFYCNGHSWLAQKLATEGIGYATADNSFIRINDFDRAQKLADEFRPDDLHRILDRYAEMCCPIMDTFLQKYHWSFMQIEYSTDLVFRDASKLHPLYEEISKEAILAAKADKVSSFLGKKVTPQLALEIGSRHSNRIEGTCTKHHMGSASVKMYDKFGRVLRIETTSNDVSFFKHHRKVEHRDGTETHEVAPLKKSIYSLFDLREILLGCNRRYLDFISSLDDHSDGQIALKKLSEPKTENGTTWKGINFFDPKDQSLLRGIQHPEFNIRGLRRADLKKIVPTLTDSALSRQLKRMRVFGLIKRVAGTYRYYMTKLGRVTVATCEHLTEFTIVPALAVLE